MTHENEMRQDIWLRLYETQAHCQRVFRCPIEFVKVFEHMIIDDYRKGV